MKKKKITFIMIGFFIGLVIGIVGFGFGFGIHLIANQEKNDKTCKQESKQEKKKVASPNYSLKQTANILFLGDSITDWYPIEEIYGDMPIVNSGISGYHTYDILDRMDSMVYRYNPTKIFLLIGTNDLELEEDQTEDTIKGIKEIIKEIRKNRKNATLYVQSIYPINRNLSSAGARYNEEIQDVNKEIEEYCKEKKVTYIDMYKELADEEGNFSEDYTKDGLHPNDLGYARISQVLIDYINE